MSKKVYETITKNGSKIRYEYEDKTYPIVEIYINDEYWGSPQGDMFMVALLKDIEIMSNKIKEGYDE